VTGALRALTSAAAVALALSGCTSAGTTTDAFPSATTALPVPAGAVPTPAHVVVVVLENKDEGSVIGAAAAPYLTSLASAGADFTDAHGVAHPSQPNYVALFSGSTHGITDDDCPQTLSGGNLAAQLLDAGRTFVGYSEDLPAVGSAVCTAGQYARKHNPWSDFADLPASVDQPYSAFPADYDQLPTVAVVVPNLCNDMHSCDVATGDAWAREQLSGYVDWARTHDSLLVVTFDESEGGSAANHIPTFFVGPMVRPGDTSTRIDHYSVLRTLEDMYGLPPLGEAAERSPVTDVWAAA
jgi:acid phosphatase